MRLFLLLLTLTLAAVGQEPLRPGVWAGANIQSLPVPVSGHQVYLLGEMHGVKEMEEVFGQYLLKLNQATGLRDVAIEEGGVYERDAEQYVEGRSDQLPHGLCLRSWILMVVRRLNQGRPADRMIRVHLVDVDSPADAIRQHLLAIAGNRVRVPAAADIKTRGLQTVEELTKAIGSSPESRTIAHSIRAYQQGLEVGTGETKGSSYLEDREQAIASNIEDLVRGQASHGVLAIYGSDHVSRRRRNDGGTNRDTPLDPTAMRLEAAGLKIATIIAFPLSGTFAWRGHREDMMWTAEDGHLASGEKFDKLLAAAHQPNLLYIDTAKEKASIPSDDITRYRPDGFLLIRTATPLDDRCTAN